MPIPASLQTLAATALLAASGKCLEGVPGMGFVFIHKAVLDGCTGNSQSLAMDLHDPHSSLEKIGPWRFTPPAIGRLKMQQAVNAIGAALREIGVTAPGPSLGLSTGQPA